MRPYWDAFWRLSDDRPVGMSVGRIPFTAVDCFARRHGVEGDEFDLFDLIIRAMDREYMDVMEEQKPKGGTNG